jgi:putative zinc finger/helix-turn-helix YgiT family protein
MKCPNCKQNKMRSWAGMYEVEGVEVFARGARCRACGEAVFDSDQVDELEKARAVALVQRGIRTGVEFKFVRKVADLKATELAELLDVTPKTVSRWETGDVELPRYAAFVLGELLERPRVVRERLRKLNVAGAR